MFVTVIAVLLKETLYIAYIFFIKRVVFEIKTVKYNSWVNFTNVHMYTFQTSYLAV
jgi:hypothetical protein